MPDKAIGLINSTVTGENRVRDEHAVAQLIRTRGYESVGMLIVDENTYMPTTLIVHTASRLGAVAVVAPALTHFGAASQAVALACTVVTPTDTVCRRRADV